MGLDHDDEIAADVALQNAAGHTGRAAHSSNVEEDSEHEIRQREMDGRPSDC